MALAMVTLTPTGLLADRPAAPAISYGQGRALTIYARHAMQSYRARRTRPDRLEIPDGLGDTLKPLVGKKYPVSVTLRGGGKVLGRRILEDGPDVLVNTATAAMMAMRSPALPDRVTADVLDALTIEVEVLSEPEPVKPDQAVAALADGNLGLRTLRGVDRAYVLPSTAYALGLDAEGIRRNAVAQLPLTPGNKDLDIRMSVFATRHFVAYPGGPGLPSGPTLWLYRGKVLTPHEAINEDMLRQSLMAMAGFLVRNQLANGRITLPGEGVSLADHLWATWTLARVADLLKTHELDNGIAQAARAASESFREQAGVSWIQTRDPDDQLAAASALVLLARQRKLPEPLPTQAGKLLAEIRRAWPADGLPPARLDGKSETRADARACAWATLATGSWTPGQLPAPADVTDARSAYWLYRAGWDPAKYATTQPAAKVPTVRFLAEGDGVLADEIGGAIAPRQPHPTAELTALAAIVHGGKDLQRAAKFGHLMSYRRAEAYFAADPNAWTGAVRHRPGSSRVTLAACVATMEALLAALEK